MNKMQFGKACLPVLLETEDACSVDGFSPIASLYLLPVLTSSACLLPARSCSLFFFVFACSKGEGSGAAGDEVGAPALAGQCLSLFSCPPCLSPMFSFSSSSSSFTRQLLCVFVLLLLCLLAFLCPLIFLLFYVAFSGL